MNYYWFNRQEILQKAKEKYSKGKAAEYYKQNKEAIKEKTKERYKNLSQEWVKKTLKLNNIILNKKKTDWLIVVRLRSSNCILWI